MLVLIAQLRDRTLPRVQIFSNSTEEAVLTTAKKTEVVSMVEYLAAHVAAKSGRILSRTIVAKVGTQIDA
jgi:hypothetical protein